MRDIDIELEQLANSDVSERECLLQEGKVIRSRLESLHRDMLSKAPLKCFTDEECEVAGVPGSFNEYLTRYDKTATWGNAEWLFLGIYMYRWVNVIFKTQKHEYWRTYDVFNRRKQDSFKGSYQGVVELASRYSILSKDLPKFDKTSKEDQRVLEILFYEFLEASLWGNATDLSLLNMVTLEELRNIQGSEVRQESRSKIVINDLSKAWDLLISQDPQRQIRVDIVLDNSGFELYTDLMFAVFLLRSGLAHKCVLHGKDTPYMVSDVTPHDFDLLFEDLLNRKLFSTEGKTDSSDLYHLLDLAVRDMQSYIDAGKIVFKCERFWTTDLDFWNIDPTEERYGGAEVYRELLNSDLVIFKGDLNYRRLTGDRHWPRTTPWEVAIGPLATSGLTILSLRTCKSDVIVGLPNGTDDRLGELWEQDHPGKGSWWCCSGKWAVACFHDSKKNRNEKK